MDIVLLDKIRTLYNEYLNDDKYVFAYGGKHKIIILQKLKSTITNENRIIDGEIIDEKYARFRADKLKIIAIFNRFDPGHKISNYKITKYKKYKVNTILQADNFCHDINTVFVGRYYDFLNGGVHYFKSIEVPFYMDICLSIDYDGNYHSWNDENGQKYKSGYYSYGKKIGVHITYLSNGSEEHTSYYDNIHNGKKLVKYYKNGILHGRWIEFYECGTRKLYGEYFNGVKWGTWKKYDIYGNLIDDDIDAYEKINMCIKNKLYGKLKNLYQNQPQLW